MPETHIELKDLTFPQAVYESLGRTFYPSILEFYENEDNKKAFEEWKKNSTRQIIRRPGNSNGLHRAD